MPFKRSRAVPLLLGVIVLTQLWALVPNSITLANSPRAKASAKPATDWSQAYTNFQNPKTGLWYQIVNKGDLATTGWRRRVPVCTPT